MNLIWSPHGPPPLVDRAILQCLGDAGGILDIDELMDATAMSAKVVRQHLAGLERAGWLSAAGLGFRLHLPPVPPRRT
jgi:DNA-binding IclR family transcriptional regulator